MPKRRDFSKVCCPKCGGKIGVIKRDLSTPKRHRMDTLGCVSGIHVQQSGTYGYDLNDFPKRQTLILEGIIARAK